MTMVRLSSGSSSQCRPTSSRSTANDHWPTPLLNTSTSPERSASPDSRSQHLSSSDSEHSPNGGHRKEPVGSVSVDDQWHAAFQHSVNETQTYQASRNVDHLLPVPFNALGQPIGDSKAYSTKVGVIAKSIVSPSFATWREVTRNSRKKCGEKSRMCTTFLNLSGTKLSKWQTKLGGMGRPL